MKSKSSLTKFFLKFGIGVDFFFLHFDVLEKIWPCLKCRSPNSLDDEVELTHFGFSSEKNITQEQFCEDASY